MELSSKERKLVDLQANLFSIIKTVEILEVLFCDNMIEGAEYENECCKLIQQFLVLKTALKEDIPDIREFMEENDLKCPLAEERLLGSGVPATKLYSNSNNSSDRGAIIHSITERALTLLDHIALGASEVSEMQPEVLALVIEINKFPGKPPKGADTLSSWLTKLNKLSASDQISADDLKQLRLNVETFYSHFKSTLDN
eukprot:GHVL01001148.1.p1 GENE.GHVL01001148.1~~GHVL01001148.1.p1  ORF type:complete len:199 (+),score=37.27 GHVL01001148.1:194-790(+)